MCIRDRNELDKFVEKTAKEFYKSRDRHNTPEYDKVDVYKRQIPHRQTKL